MAFSLTKMLGLGKKGSSISYNETPEYSQLRDLLYNTSIRGIPEIGNIASSRFQKDILPGIRESYQARRNLGIGSTPEVQASLDAGTRLQDSIAQQDYQNRMNAMNMLSGITPRPQQVYTPESDPLANLLNFSAPVGSSLLNNYFQSGQTDKLMQYLSPSKDVTQKSPGSVYDDNSDPNSGMDLMSLIALFGGM